MPVPELLMPDIVETTAPGKVVLWGEYAVLAGVPAAVMAVDRFATCRITSHKSGFRLHATGFEMKPVDTPDLRETSLPTSARLFAAAASALISTPRENLNIVLDTSTFQGATGKLGIGSSAAALVACYGALAA